MSTHADQEVRHVMGQARTDERSEAGTAELGTAARAWLATLPSWQAHAGVTTRMALEALGLDACRRHEMLIGKALRELGYRHKRCRFGERLEWRYFPPGAPENARGEPLGGSEPTECQKPPSRASAEPVPLPGDDDDAAWGAFGRALGQLVEEARPTDLAAIALARKRGTRPDELLALSERATSAAIERLEGKAP